MASFLSRYQGGEREQVWVDLLELGSQVRQESIFTDAWSVARATMERVRYNIETLIPRLSAIGYRFGEGLFPFAPLDPETMSGPIYAAPKADASERVAELERLVGPIPLSMRAFYEVVGSVNLVGMHPEWPREISPDPLFVYPIEIQIQMCRDWLARKASAGKREPEPQYPITLTVAPDEESKYGVEGGVYEMAVPAPVADGNLLFEQHRTTFVNYLRICLRWAGFPGLERAPNPPLRDIEQLTRDLLPI